MFQIKSELNQILGKLEALEQSGSFSGEDVYQLLEKAYFIISDSFDIEQCHSTVHELKNHMRIIKGFPAARERSRKEMDQILQEALGRCIRELRVFVSHL